MNSLHVIIATGGTMAGGLLDWLGCMACAMVLFNQAARFWNQITGRSADTHVFPRPLEVKGVEKMATHSECLEGRNLLLAEINAIKAIRASDQVVGSGSREKIYAEIKGVRNEMGDMERRLQKADEDRSVKLHDRINDILEAVGELRGHIRRGI